MLKKIVISLVFWTSVTLGQDFSPILDHESLFSKNWQQSMASSLIKFYQQTEIQLQIVTTPDFKGQSIEAYSIELADQLKLGRAKTDKGLLLLISAQQRKVRLEVGQGLEGDIPDLLAKRIINQLILPEFKKQQYEAGVGQAVSYLQKYLGGESFSQSESLTQSESERSKLGGGFLFLIFILIAIFKLGLMGSGIGPFIGGPRGGSGWGGGGGSGWGGGGGGFSGGGASGSW